MRALRLLALLAVLLVAYFAQYVFDNGTLAHLYPGWMTQRFPLLVRTTLWLPGDLYTLALWLLGGSALLFGLLVPRWGTSRKSPPPGEGGTSWRWGLGRWGLGAGVALLVAWGWTGLPVRIDAVTARFGLEAQALLTGQGAWLAPSATGAPQIAALPSGLLALLLQSGPAAAHLLGLTAALVTVTATYLLAVELFDAAHPHPPALLAAGFSGCTLAMLHFGRLAPFLPATAAGTAAAWLLLAAQRRQKTVFLAASGLLTALACWLDRSGVVFALTLLAWWSAGVLACPPAPEQARTPALQRAGEDACAPTSRRGRLRSTTWIICLLLGLAPLLIASLLAPQAVGVYLRGGQTAAAVDWLANLRATAATFFWLPDASTVFGPAGHYVNSLPAPLFVLGLGGLLWSLDRPLGWRLLTWLGIGLLFSSATNALAPYWPTLLPLLPLVGIAVVYALDRVAALWEEGDREGDGEGDGAAVGTLASLGVGLLLVAAAITWVQYYEFAAANGDGPSYTGRALAALPPDAVAVLLSSSPQGAVRLDDPVVQFAAGPRANQAMAVTVDALPAGLPPGSQVLVQGGDTAALAAVRAEYPGAAVEVVRDLRGNPRLYVVRITTEGRSP